MTPDSELLATFARTNSEDAFAENRQTGNAAAPLNAARPAEHFPGAK